jgi:hypothetical protein
MNHNHANYQARLDFVQGLVRDRLSLGVSDSHARHCPGTEKLTHEGQDGADIVPVQYDPDSPFKYNNFVYRVARHLPVPAGYTTTSNAVRQPGCVAIPEGTNELIVRLTNPATEGMNMANRVENEVAVISLASAALDHFRPAVVPRVFGWGSATSTASSADKPAQG